MKPIKTKLSKCKICGCEYVRLSLSHRTDKPECAIELVKIERAKKQHKEAAKKKLEIRTRSEWIKIAQTVFNKYIRLRDADKTCICCDKPLKLAGVGGEFDCGHYRSIGSAPHLRFNPDNAHGQRKQCNRWGSGRAVDYRLGLIKRIGIEKVEMLEADQSPRKYTIEELQEIIREYKEKTKELMKQKSPV